MCTRCFSADLRSESVCDLGSQIVSAWSYVFLSGPRKNDSLKILPQQLTTEEFFFGLQRNCVNIIYFQVTTAVAKRSQDEFSSSSDAKITQNLDLMSFCRLRSTSKAKKSTPQMAGIVCDQFVDSWYIPRSFKLLIPPTWIFLAKLLTAFSCNCWQVSIFFVVHRSAQLIRIMAPAANV